MLCGLWLGFGVAISELARFACYEAIFVGLPGVLVYRALSRNPGGALRHVAIGWPVGYAIEIGGFVLTAALDVRGLFPFAGLAVAAAAAAYLRLRRRHSEREPLSDAIIPAATPFPPTAVWAVAGIASVALGYLALAYFVETPLPRDADSVSYYVDNVWDIGLVAEAKNHWPMENPDVTGVPLRYQLFGFIHMAAVSQVTGIEPSTLLFRLVPAWLIVLVTLQVVGLGRELCRTVWIGPVAAALVLGVGELDLDPERTDVAAGVFFIDLFYSPTFLFGIPLFLAATTLLLPALSGRRGPGTGTWLLLGILLFVCGGAKASILPIFLGALVLWLGWSWLRERSLLRSALTALCLSLSAFILTYALLYTGGGSAGFSYEVFGFTQFTVIEELIDPATRSPVGDVLLIGATGVLAGAANVLPTLGIIWLLAKRRLRVRPGEAWLLALFATSLGAFFVLNDGALGQAYFLHYGYITGCVLSAQGLLLFFERCAQTWERPGAVLGRLVALGLAAGCVAALVLYVGGPDKAGLGRLGVGYGIAAVAVAALALWARHAAAGRTAATGAGVALLLTITLGLLDTPLDEGVTVARQLNANHRLHLGDERTGPRGLTGELYEGLRWVRRHSEKDDTIAVNNHAIDAAGLDSRYYYYTAFTERRAFLQSWHYTIDSQDIGYERVARGEEIPFPRLRELNAAVFDRGSPPALETLTSDYGVDFLLVDRRHGTASPKLRRIGPPSFENEALTVYSLE